jgi:hypothetical protein
VQIGSKVYAEEAIGQDEQRNPPHLPEEIQPLPRAPPAAHLLGARPHGRYVSGEHRPAEWWADQPSQTVVLLAVLYEEAVP